MGTIGIRLEDLPLRAQQQALAQLKTAQIQKARKYRNEPEMAEGIRFDSKKEAGRFRELQAMLQAGLIRELRLQQDFTLQEAYTTPGGRRIRAIRYCADFCYERKTQTGWEKIVEDVKSRATRTQKYIIKRKMMQDRYQALFEFVTTDATATAVCMKHCLSKSTLHRMVRRYYEDFPKKL